MDGLVYSNHCLNISDIELKQLQGLRIFSIIDILLLLVPALILQLFFICRYKSTFLHRQFLYTTIGVILLYITNIVGISAVDVVCPFFFYLTGSLGDYISYVEILQMTTIHLLLLYQLSKPMQTRIMQRLQTLCCNIRPRLWHEVMIVCIQLGLPLPILINEIVVIMKITPLNEVETYYFINPLLVAVNILLGLICIVMLVVWFRMLWKIRLLKSKVKFVCTHIGHILFVLVVYLIGNILLLLPLLPIYNYNYGLEVTPVMQTFPPVSFSVYILMSLPNLRSKVTSKAQVPVTNLHTNPPSTRVSLPTDTAEHAPNFLSPSTTDPSEVTLLVNN